MTSDGAAASSAKDLTLLGERRLDIHQGFLALACAAHLLARRLHCHDAMC